MLCAEASNGVIRKYWVHSNNWNNPKNWDVSPDPCDPVILSDRGESLTIYISFCPVLHGKCIHCTFDMKFSD